MELTPGQKNVLQQIGSTLLAIQLAEKAIRPCMTFVIQKDDGGLTLEALETQKVAEARKTLGYFLAELRKRVQVDKEFDDRLRRFLKMRNDFVHDLHAVPGWGTNTDAEIKASSEFLTELSNEAFHVMGVFAGVMRAWQEQVNMEDSFKDIEFFRVIDAVYKPMAAQLFSKK